MKLFHAGLRQNHLRALKFLQFSLNYVLLRLSVLRSLQAFETYCFLVFCAWCNIVPCFGSKPVVFNLGARVDILCTQLYYIWFIRVLDGGSLG